MVFEACGSADGFEKSETLGCIAGGIAEAFFGQAPRVIHGEVKKRLTPDLWEIMEAFCRKCR